MNKRIMAIVVSICAGALLSCAAKDSGYYSVTKAVDLELTDDQAKAGAVILLEEDRIDIRNRNLCYWDHRQVKKILRPRQSEEGFFRFPDSGNNRIETILARVTYPDGREEVLTELDIERLPDFEQFVLYSDNCSRIFEFSGLRPGTVIEVQIRYRFDNLAFIPSVDFQRYIPIIEKRLNLEYPGDMDISIYAVAMEDEPDANIALPGGRRGMKWERSDIEAFEPETSMPPERQYIPSLWIKVLEKHNVGAELDLSSWRGVSEWYEELSSGSMKCGKRTAGLFELERRAGRTDEEVARAIFKKVQRDFRYVAIYLGLGGYMPHDAEETTGKLYGDCKDQSVVLATALREAGIESRLVLVRTANLGRFEDPSPMFGYFNHVIVAAELNGSRVFLDPTCKTCSFGVLPHILQGAHGLVIGDERTDLIQLPHGGRQKNRMFIKTAIRVNEMGEAVLRDTILCSGYFSEVYRGYFENREGRTPEEVAKKVFLDNHPFAELQKCEIIGEDPASDSLVMFIEAWIPDFVEDRQTLFLEPAFRKTVLPEIELADRTYPLYLGPLHEIDIETTVEVPSGWELDGFPDLLTVDNDLMNFSGRFRKTDTGFHLRRTKAIRAGIVLPEAFSEFEEATEAIRKFEDSKILVQKGL